jgi:hypothetical protein
MTGFGASARIRTDRIEPELDDMIGGGLITLERARVIMYRPGLPAAERTDNWRIEQT